MDVRIPRYAPLVLLLLAVVNAGCDSAAVSVNAPSPPVPLSSSVAVEPLVVRPEFLHGATCAPFSPFGLRLRILVGGPRDLMLRGLRFQLTDRFGARALPEVIPLPSGMEAALPSTLVSPLPGAAALPTSPIPIPGASPMTGVNVAAGTTQSLAFFLRFGCGIAPEGSLFVITDVADGDGRPGTSQIRVRVG
jgi:hypothetical protein